MAISLKEALEKHPDFIIEKQKKDQQRKEEKIKKACDKIDAIILEEIMTIIERPIYKVFDISWLYDCADDIEGAYKDFTISFGFFAGTTSIKLADKDWDWQGYGIKEGQAKDKQPVPTRIDRFIGLFKSKTPKP